MPVVWSTVPKKKHNPKQKLALGAGIPELVKLLQSRGKDVFLVSGGFRVIIEPIAEILQIPVSNVFANTILHKVADSPFTLSTDRVGRGDAQLTVLGRPKVCCAN